MAEFTPDKSGPGQAPSFPSGRPASETETAGASSTAASPSPDLVFLARRLVRKAGDNGVSSDALIACAATGSPMSDEFAPLDLADYGRCCEAFSLAPYDLRRRMLPQLVAWGQMLIEKEASRAAS